MKDDSINNLGYTDFALMNIGLNVFDWHLNNKKTDKRKTFFHLDGYTV